MAMEACCGAHHLGRVLREQGREIKPMSPECEQGHEIKLMSPEYVQPYVKAQKNDERDAEAIAEVSTRQATTGGKPRLLGITNRGNTYLLTLLIHGPWAQARLQPRAGDEPRACGVRF